MEKFKNIIVNPKITIKQALKHMDEAGEKMLLVADENRRLLGTVTDGDIRRWILKGDSLSDSVSKVMNKSPIFLSEGYGEEEARDLMVSQVIECVPVLNKNKQIVSAIRWLDLFEKRITKHKPINIPIVIMAGGIGSRLSPFTNILPKPLMPIGDKPIVELIMDKFIEFGCKDIYLSVNHKSSILKAYFRDHQHNYKIKYIEEGTPLGTIGSLYLAKDKLKSTFILSNCDILIEADYYDIVKFHNDNKNLITLIVSLKHYTIPYGVCEIENGGILKSIKEKPEYDFLVNTGSYILEPDVLRDIPRNKIYHATDLITAYIEKGKKIGVYPVSEKSWLDMGQWEEYQKNLKKFEAK